LNLHLPQCATARDRVDVERRRPRELFAAVRGDVDVGRDADRLLGALGDASAALNARRVR
jgi:hypothetical protein